MADKELRKMSRAELIEIIYALQQNEKIIRAENEKLQEQLEDRTLRIENAGSIAEAALSLNHIFDDAQKAAEQYLLSIENSSKDAQKIVDAANEKAEALLSEATEKADMMVDEATEKSEAMVNEATEKAETLVSEATEKADTLLSDATEKSETMLSEATEKADTMVNEATEKLEAMLSKAKRKERQVKKLLREALEEYEGVE